MDPHATLPKLRFSAEWHRFWADNFEGESPFRDFDDWLADKEQLTSVLVPLESVEQIKGGQEVLEPLSKDWWRLCAFHVDLVRRILLHRTVLLVTGVIQVLNSENYVAAYPLLRAALEQGAIGLFASVELDKGRVEAKVGGDSAAFRDLQLRLAYGSRLNQGPLRAAIRRTDTQKPAIVAWIDAYFDLVRDRRNEFRNLGEARAAGIEHEFAVNVLDAIDLADREWKKSGVREHGHYLRSVYALLSDFSHPNVESWSHLFDVVTKGGSQTNATSAVGDDDRMTATFTIGMIGREFVLPLIDESLEDLSLLLSEVEAEVGRKSWA